MKFIENFVTQIKKFNGQIVNLKIVQIDGNNHPLGAIGAMMMGNEQSERIKKANSEYKSKNGLIEIDAEMELIINSGEEKLIFLNNTFDCNCIEIFRPDPPMVISGADISLWWSYHPLYKNEYNQLSVLKKRAEIRNTSTKGDCHPIRDIIVNGISHCLQRC